jgi:transmembrane sensor
MSYENYTLEDFLTDREFKNWVLNPESNTHLFWEKWIDSHPEQEETIFKAKELILSYRFKEPELISEEEQEEILKGILGRKKVLGRQKPKLYFLGYAAAIGLLITFSVFVVSIFSNKPAETPVSMVVKENPAGQKSTIRLPDGTRVWLNSASRITFPDKFINDRTVELQGEAYFEVKKDPEKLFKVTSNGLITTALGTSFNIRAYNEQQEVEVLLVTGKVSVEPYNKDPIDPQEKVFMHPGEQIIYNKDYQTLTKSLSKDRKGILWKDGIISFRKAGFEQIKNELERWYGVKIEVQHLNRELSYTADFDNESLERVLERMSFTEKFSFKMKEDTIKIKFD